MVPLRVLALVFLVLLPGCGGGAGDETPDGVASYVLDYQELNVAGVLRSTTYTVEDDQMSIVSRGRQGEVVDETTRTLTADEQERAAGLAQQALGEEQQAMCSDSPRYRLTITHASGEQEETSYTRCDSSESESALLKLEQILLG